MKSVLRFTSGKRIQQLVVVVEWRKATKIILNNFISLRVSMLFLQYKSCYFKHIAEQAISSQTGVVYIQPFE